MSDLPELLNYPYLTSASLQKAKTPARAVLRPGGRQDFLLRRRLCRRWARNYAYPGSIPNSSKEGLSMSYRLTAVKVGGGPPEQDLGDRAARVLSSWR